MNIADIRQDYRKRSLGEADVAPDPIEQFDRWWQEAINSNIEEVNAMTLATANDAGRPSARIVLLKGFDQDGFVFFTNYESHKAADIEVNPWVSIVFFWKELERQVRVEGRVKKINNAESEAYFDSRPIGSRIGAWASPQSQVIPSREMLEERVKEVEKKFQHNTIEKPPHWGGYVVMPELVEFWQGRSNRLHDRIQYTLFADGWVIERLAP